MCVIYGLALEAHDLHLNACTDVLVVDCVCFYLIYHIMDKQLMWIIHINDFI